MGKEAGMAAGIEETAGVAGLNIWDVVVAADEEVYATDTVEDIQGFGFKDGAVTFAGGGMKHCHNYIRLLLCADIVNIFLDYVNYGKEIHSAPYFFPKPGLYIGIFVAHYRYAQARLLYHHI